MSAHCANGFDGRTVGREHTKMRVRAKRFARNAAYTGVVTGAVMATFLAPSTAQAAPSTADELDKVKADYEKAVEKRDGLSDRIADLDHRIAGSDRAIDGAMALLSDPGAAAASGGSLLSRLTDLSDLARRQSAAIDTAGRAIADANAEKDRLEADLERAEDTVEDLAERREDLEDELAAEAARTSDSTYDGPIPEVSGRAGAAVSFAYNAIGIPYVYGAAGPDAYDCSGLTMAAWEQAGVSLPHNTNQQWNATTPIGRDQLAPGDLVFYNGLGHVAIYVGDGRVIHAPQPGESVKISDVDMMTPDGFRRV